MRAPSLPQDDSSLFGFLSLKMFDTSFRAGLRVVLESSLLANFATILLHPEKHLLLRNNNNS
jgi:hypothetical protein